MFSLQIQISIMILKFKFKCNYLFLGSNNTWPNPSIEIVLAYQMCDAFRIIAAFTYQQITGPKSQISKFKSTVNETIPSTILLCEGLIVAKNDHKVLMVLLCSNHNCMQWICDPSPPPPLPCQQDNQTLFSCKESQFLLLIGLELWI